MRSIFSATSLLLAFAAGLAQQTASRERIYKIGNGVHAARAIFTPAPDNPIAAKKIKYQGVVVLSGYVGIDGNYHDARVVRSTGKPVLDSSALEKVKTWKFHPCIKDDKPVNCAMNLEVAFNLY